MKPYYDSGLVLDLGGRIHTLIQKRVGTRPQIIAFSADTMPVRTLEEVGGLAFGTSTLLDNAIGDAIERQYSIVWLITDNIEHQPGTQEGDNTTAFYEKLRGDPVKKVLIFPLVQTQGMSGIVIYAMLLSSQADSIFEDEITEFTNDIKRSHNTEHLRMKPLDSATIESTLARSDQKHRDRAVYNEGQSIHETMEVRFKSRFEHLKVTDADIEADVRAEFGQTTLFTLENPHIAITPKKVTELDPGGETEQVYSVSVDVGKVRLKRDLASIWKAAWSKTGEEGTVNVSFLIRVPRENFQFKKTFLDAYNARTPQEARQTGKVYALDKLPSLLAERVTLIPVESPQPFRVKYPWWPGPLFIILGLFIVGLIIFGGRFASRSFAGSLKGKPKWDVLITAPSEGRGTIQGGWVAIPLGGRSVRVGQMKGGTLLPGPGVTPKTAQPIKEGVPINLKYRNTDFSLIFRQGAG
ncbi:MAG: hypothetical protein AABN34_22905 [Acidobacteriota bacterium]